MKNKFFINFLILMSVIQLQAQKITTKDFNLPDNTLQQLTSTYLYEGETKKTSLQEQTKYEFKNGFIQKEAIALVLSKIMYQYVYSYDENNQLINKSSSRGSADIGVTHNNDKISYKKEGNTLMVLKNGQLYITKHFDDKSNLTQEDIYDAQSNYIFEKTTFKDGAKTTTRYNPNLEPVLKTTEYLNKDNKPIIKIVFNSKYPNYETVTSYTYDVNGNFDSS